jgi:hypothetical protein
MTVFRFGSYNVENVLSAYLLCLLSWPKARRASPLVSDQLRVAITSGVHADYLVPVRRLEVAGCGAAAGRVL